MKDRVAAFVFLTIFLDLFGFAIVFPIFPFYVRDMGGSPFTLGLILSLFSLAQLVATPLLGRLSDRVGRRKVIVLSLAGNAVSMLVFALATQKHMLALLFVSRIVAGATAGNIAACQAAIADVTEGSERAKGMGRVGAAIGLGMMLGPAAGGVLVELGAAAPPLAAAALALVDLLGAFFFMPETRQPSRDAGEARAPTAPSARAPGKNAIFDAFRDGRLVVVFAMFFLLFIGMSAMQTSLALLTQDRLGWAKGSVSKAFALSGAIQLVVQGALIERIVKRFDVVHVAMVGGALEAAGLLGIGAAPSSAPLVAGLAALALGMGIAMPVLPTMATDFAREGRRGAVLGVAQGSGVLARVVGPLWAGFLYHFGPGVPFFSGAAAAALLALLGVTLKRGAGIPEERVAS